MGRTRILILGGTTEARLLAGELAKRDGVDVLLSLAGRTKEPIAHAVAVRTGGFGGSEGLAAYLRAQVIDFLVDATHPFATQISANAKAAARESGVPCLTLRREPWMRVAGDQWHGVSDVPEALSALGDRPRRVFLAVGRQEAHCADRFPQHYYLVRSVDPIEPPLSAPDVVSILARGPFRLEDEIRLMKQHLIDCVVSKNSGGTAAYPKIEAARRLGIPVLMIGRGHADAAEAVHSVEAALQRIDHWLSDPAKRGV
jgi:precorrin-6A/cobalt-precorrin-6A reductase